MPQSCRPETFPPLPSLALCIHTHKRVAAAVAAEFPPERNYHAAEQLGMTDGPTAREGRGDGADVRALRNVAMVNHHGGNFA